ncbi:MAG: AMP-binding protein [Porticoccus sp.]|nr:AMP-binding protein [Porticoccus sp.]
MRLVDCLDRSLALSGSITDSAGFVDLENNVTLTYQEMVYASVHLADHLILKGISSGDVVATYAPNSVAAYCCIFAISRIGAVWLPLNVRNTLDANLKLIEKSGAALLFMDERIAVQNPELTNSFGDEQLIFLDGHQVAGLTFSSLRVAPENDFDSDEKPWSAEEGRGGRSSVDVTVSLLATGGTTGDSKLAEWGSATWEAMINVQRELMPPPDIPSCYLVAAPMSHAAGVASFATILQGGAILVMDGLVPEKLLATIERFRVTSLFLPPTAIYMLLAYEGVKNYDYSSLRYFWYAAAPMSVEKLKEAISVFGPVMVQTYGQVEAPMMCTFLSARDHVEALETGNASMLRSCGKTAPHVELAIVDDDGHRLPLGQKGEIAVKGDLLMKGYYKNPEATREIRFDGWQLTGDVGVFDQNGYLAIVDRKRDMIISGGFNVYPSEIEQLIWGLPAIKDCAVIGVPDEKWGEQVTAVIELKDPDCIPDEQEIIQYCKDRLGSVKAPKQVLFWDALPRSPVGKVLKKEIRKVFWDEQGRNI